MLTSNYGVKTARETFTLHSELIMRRNQNIKLDAICHNIHDNIMHNMSIIIKKLQDFVVFQDNLYNKNNS